MTEPKDNWRKRRPRPRPGSGVGDLFFPPDAETIKLRQERAAAAQKKRAEPEPTTAANLRRQVIAFLESADLAETISWPLQRGPGRAKYVAQHVEFERQRLLKKLKGE